MDQSKCVAHDGVTCSLNNQMSILVQSKKKKCNEDCYHGWERSSYQ